MKTVILNKKPLKITASEERALRIMRKKNFVAKKDEFVERKSGNRFRSFLPEDTRLGFFLERNFRSSDWMQSSKAAKFFKHNPLCRHVVLGDVRRMNTILNKIESGDFV